jgi:hypothetical protein
MQAAIKSAIRRVMGVPFVDLEPDATEDRPTDEKTTREQ